MATFMFAGFWGALLGGALSQLTSAGVMPPPDTSRRFVPKHIPVRAVAMPRTPAGGRAGSVRQTRTWGRDPLALLPDGAEKRGFIIDCTGCHQMDMTRAFPAGAPRDAAGWRSAVERMLGFAGATTGFPVIGSQREGVGTGMWLQEHWSDPARVPRYQLAATAAHGKADIRTWLLDDANDLPHDIAVDSGGRVVVTGMMTHQMLVLDTTNGVWRRVPIPVPNANPRALEIDAAGRWWVALGRPRKVARYDPRVPEGEWLVADAGVYAHSVALAPDGSAWLNGHFSRAPEVIARVDTVRRVVENVSLPAHTMLSDDPGGPIPYELRVAPDGTVWTSELQGNRLIGYHPGSGVTRVIEMPEPLMGPRRFDVASDGSLWVPAYAANELVHLTPGANGAVSVERFPLPVANLLPYVVRMDPVRGGLWLGTGAGDVVLHFAPQARTFTSYALPEPGALIRHLTIAPGSGDVWLAYGASPGIAARVARLRP